MADRSGILHHDTDNVRSVAQLVQDVVRDLQEIVRSEINLAKAEVSEKTSRASKVAGMFGGAAVAGLLGAMALTAAIIAALSLVVALWLSALIVAVVLLGAAGTMFLQGREKLRGLTPVPEQTVETLKEDVEWAKHRTK